MRKFLIIFSIVISSIVILLLVAAIWHLTENEIPEKMDAPVHIVDKGSNPAAAPQIPTFIKMADGLYRESANAPCKEDSKGVNKSLMNGLRVCSFQNEAGAKAECEADPDCNGYININNGIDNSWELSYYPIAGNNPPDAPIGSVTTTAGTLYLKSRPNKPPKGYKATVNTYSPANYRCKPGSGGTNKTEGNNMWCEYATVETATAACGADPLCLGYIRQRGTPSEPAAIALTGTYKANPAGNPLNLKINYEPTAALTQSEKGTYGGHDYYPCKLGLGGTPTPEGRCKYYNEEEAHHACLNDPDCAGLSRSINRTGTYQRYNDARLVNEWVPISYAWKESAWHAGEYQPIAEPRNLYLKTPEMAFDHEYEEQFDDRFALLDDYSCHYAEAKGGETTTANSRNGGKSCKYPTLDDTRRACSSDKRCYGYMRVGANDYRLVKKVDYHIDGGTIFKKMDKKLAPVETDGKWILTDSHPKYRQQRFAPSANQEDIYTCPAGSVGKKQNGVNNVCIFLDYYQAMSACEKDPKCKAVIRYGAALPFWQYPEHRYALTGKLRDITGVTSIDTRVKSKGAPLDPLL